MNRSLSSTGPSPCTSNCTPSATVETLNRECFCLSVDEELLRSHLNTVLGVHGLPRDLAESHPHLFSALPVYVSHRHIEQTANVVTAVEEVVSSPSYQLAVLAWAPEIAVFDPGSPGGLLGLDFHLTSEGPRLIEINTNPGGALLNAVLVHAQKACMPELTVPPTDSTQIDGAVVNATLVEWHLQRGSAPLKCVAIVDESPTQQYLYPEFILYRELFRRHGYQAEICGPEDLVLKQGRLWLGESQVDLVYNRLTDFALQQSSHSILRAAYLAGAVAMSPHPRAHALYADKRNLSLMGNREFLQASGISLSSIDTLTAAVPVTRLLTTDNREEMWAGRRHLFFKPAAGFGSKASYRGDKVTRRVWNEMVNGPYVAQDVVAPSERHTESGSAPLKVDIRCYAYRGEVLLYAARMYQGQTTNFRTQGGGFAPVLAAKNVSSTDPASQ